MDSENANISAAVLLALTIVAWRFWPGIRDLVSDLLGGNGAVGEAP